MSERGIGDNGGPPLEIVWSPIPNSSQELALDSRAHHTLYHGARGPGKTDTQLMRFRRRVGMGYGPFWRGVIFDREYKNLDDLVTKSKRWFNAFEDGARWISSKDAYKWVWPTGEELMFRTAKTVSDYWNYHGQEFPFIGWNELTKYPTDELYQMMMSTNRSSYTPEKDGWIGGTRPRDGGPPVGIDGDIPPPIPLEVFSTTNPYGPGHVWVKGQFIDPAPEGDPIFTETEINDPRTKAKLTVRKSQIAIFGSYVENIYLSPEYIADLERITDPARREAWLKGSWDIQVGGALSDVFRRNRHVPPQFPIPKGWRIDRAMDWGSSHPFSIGWFAEANGEEAILPDGTSWCPPPKSLIQISELYGTEKLGSNKGVKWGSKRVAREIIAHEIMLLEKKLIFTTPSRGPADNQIRNVNDDDTLTIEQGFNAEGIYWESSDKAKGSRKVGLQLMRDRLQDAIDGEGPGLWFFPNCVASLAIIPIVPRDEDDPDDVDTTSEDHCYDMVRYRVLANKKYYGKVHSRFAR